MSASMRRSMSAECTRAYLKSVVAEVVLGLPECAVCDAQRLRQSALEHDLGVLPLQGRVLLSELRQPLGRHGHRREHGIGLQLVGQVLRLLQSDQAILQKEKKSTMTHTHTTS